VEAGGSDRICGETGAGGGGECCGLKMVQVWRRERRHVENWKRDEISSVEMNSNEIKQ
jgi:hypothetical protein